MFNILILSDFWPSFSLKRVKILILTKTMLDADKARLIATSLPFMNMDMTKTMGFIGGIWLLWN